jgi:hypothetical protein
MNSLKSKSRLPAWSCALGWLVLGWAGCAHAPLPVGPTARVEGQGKFEFVRPPPPSDDGKVTISSQELLTKDEYVPPRPLGELKEPAYPAAALAAREGPVTVGMRLVVDLEGRVTDLSPSVLTLTTPTQFTAEFRAAIEAAVAQWRFRPAEVRHFTTRTNSEGTYRSMTGSEPTEWALHVAFTFNTTGVVPMATVNSAAKK